MSASSGRSKSPSGSARLYLGCLLSVNVSSDLLRMRLNVGTTGAAVLRKGECGCNGGCSDSGSCREGEPLDGLEDTYGGCGELLSEPS